MFIRFSANLSLILLFAFAQIGAVTHEISHFDFAAKHHQQDENSHSEQCEQCISFAKIAGGLVALSFEFPISQANLIGSIAPLTQASSQPNAAYAARAPPH